MKKTLILAALAIATLAGCQKDADVASRNLSNAADMFEINRRVVFYNGITGEYMLPGLVRSRTDGQVHHVGASNLAMLYRVPMSQCIVMPPQTPANHRERMALLERVRAGELIGLTPRDDGNYVLPGDAR